MPKFKEYSDNTWTVKMKKPKKVKETNPDTLRLKTYKRQRTMVTKVAPQDRTFKNIPKYADGKSKVDFRDWLGIKGEKISSNDSVPSYGKAENGKWYGWSHRAVYGFKVGDTVKADAAGNHSGKDYEIKNDDQAKQAAIDFAKEVS